MIRKRLISPKSAVANLYDTTTSYCVAASTENDFSIHIFPASFRLFKYNRAEPSPSYDRFVDCSMAYSIGGSSRSVPSGPHPSRSSSNEYLKYVEPLLGPSIQPVIPIKTMRANTKVEKSLFGDRDCWVVFLTFLFIYSSPDQSIEPDSY